MLVDGKQIAKEIVEALKAKRASMTRVPSLGIVVGVDDPVTSAYINLKLKTAADLGVAVQKEVLPAGADTAQAIAAVERLSKTSDGVVVQLPVPATIDAVKVLSAVPLERDVDALNPTVAEDARKVIAPVAEAVREILTRHSIEVQGKKALVVGQGQLVGAPAAALLTRLGAAVAVVTLQSGTLAQLADADIVVLGAGSPGLIQPEMLKPGVVLIDAGTSEQGGKVVGDADPRCADVASLFTPVPGGVGPLTIATLFRNLFALTENK